MAKRKPLGSTLDLATRAKAKKAAGGSPAPDAESETITTGIHLPRETWNLLRSVAFKRAEMTGRRASVSTLLKDLVEGLRPQLEKELK